MAGKGVDSLSILQVHGDYPKDGMNWLEVDKMKEGFYDEGCVSCLSTLLLTHCVS